jgi:hypothetical protein
MSKRNADFMQNVLKKKKNVLLKTIKKVYNPPPISSNQPMKNLDIDLISNQNKGT